MQPTCYRQFATLNRPCSRNCFSPCGVINAVLHDTASATASATFGLGMRVKLSTILRERETAGHSTSSGQRGDRVHAEGVSTGSGIVCSWETSINQFIRQMDQSATYIDMHEIHPENFKIHMYIK